MIKVQQVGFKTGGTYLIRDLTTSFAPGKLNLIIGPNGAGKSTFIKLLSGQLKACEGDIRYEGIPLQNIDIRALARIRAVLSQNIELSFPLTVWEVVMMGRYAHFNGKPGKKDIDACMETMSLFDVQNFADRGYDTLSGGEKQRVHFARILAQIWYVTPGRLRYLFLDEPLTFLDVHHQFEFMNQLTSLVRLGDLVVVGVVHDLNLAIKYADNITLLCNGNIVADGMPNIVLSPENIKLAYQLDPTIIAIEGRNYIFF